MKQRRWPQLGNRGTTALEMAMLGPLLVLLVLMLFEIGMQATVAAALDFGARRASRLGITGSISPNGPPATEAERRTALRAQVLAATGGLLQDARLEPLKFSSIVASIPVVGAGPGAAGQVMRYELTYVQPLLTGSLAATVLQRTQFTHHSTVVVVNEPFPTK